MDKIKIVEIKGQRVLTTKQVAEAYEVDELKISHNFGYNKSKYVEGKHYIVLKGDELRQFKNCCGNSSVVGKRTSILYLWTEKGALLHAKSLNTDKAWEVYDYLVDYYFRQQSKVIGQQPSTEKPVSKNLYVDIPVNGKAQALIKELRDTTSGIDAVLGIYDRYSKEEDFQKVAYVLSNLCMKVADLGISLKCIKPNMIERKM